MAESARRWLAGTGWLPLLAGLLVGLAGGCGERSGSESPPPADPPTSPSPSATPSPTAESGWTAPDEAGLSFAVKVTHPHRSQDFSTEFSVRNDGAAPYDVSEILCRYCLLELVSIENSWGSPLLRGSMLEGEHGHGERLLATGETAASAEFDLRDIRLNPYWWQTLTMPGTYTLSWRGANVTFTVAEPPALVPAENYQDVASFQRDHGLTVVFALDRRELRPGDRLHYRMTIRNETDSPILFYYNRFPLPQIYPSTGTLTQFVEGHVSRPPPAEVIVSPGESLVTEQGYDFQKKDRGYCLGTFIGWTVIPEPGTYFLAFGGTRVPIELDW